MSLFNKVGDRLLDLVVPKTTASAEAGWYTACYCHDYYTTWVYKYCDSSGVHSVQLPVQRVLRYLIECAAVVR